LIESGIAYFIAVIIGIVGFAVLLSRGGALVRKSKG